ncbi:MAG: hypothetical protein HY548_05300 [Elusimicrobia bacterium]|nr:hypothetical protein [Elusimicrobiota bacterium]
MFLWCSVKLWLPGQPKTEPRWSDPEEVPIRGIPAPFSIHEIQGAQNVVIPPPDAPAPSPRASSSASIENDVTVMYSVLEERFAELSRRIAAIEGSRTGDADAPPKDGPDLSPGANALLKRLEEMEGEISKLKLYIADITSPIEKGSNDLAAISQKVDGIQKIIESLTAETEVSKLS